MTTPKYTDDIRAALLDERFSSIDHMRCALTALIFRFGVAQVADHVGAEMDRYRRLNMRTDQRFPTDHVYRLD